MWSREEFCAVVDPGVIGMIHLPALPGSPGWAGDLVAVEQFAQREAEALVGGGVTAIMIENYNDIPFYPARVPAATVAVMTRLVGAVRDAFPAVKIGVNVLRNDALAAVAIAVATSAHFVRVNVHTGGAVTDQGPIVGRAWETLRCRRELGADQPDSYVGILADVRVKHARPMAQRPLAEEAADLRLRGLADGVIVTGVATGAGADPGAVAEVRTALPDCPLLVGSGMTVGNIERFVPAVDGCIVGSSLQEVDPRTGGVHVSVDRASAFVEKFRAASRR